MPLTGSDRGKRGYAIARCFIDLGLRAIEVARLQLDDFDWARGTVQIRGKGHRMDTLPLPALTGRAIVDYVRSGRPKTECRALFINHRPPRGTAATVNVVRKAIVYAAARCGLGDKITGPHILRHTMAQRLVQGGASLKEIADFLRHRSLNTTTIYAKLDEAALARVSLPWPGSRA